MIYKHSLPNGLTVVICPRHYIPKVSVQLWYRVGSKYEKHGQKGLAHLLEHMTFKGTKKLSECDINAIGGKLSAYVNAFTSQDYTAYVYDMPHDHWTVALDLLADTMTNCTFRPDLLDSELSVVLQELKLYRDLYETTLEEELISLIFAGHPYHYPIIGFKQDLMAVTQEKLLDFYATYYAPNNATLFIVGDVDYHAALKEATHYFGGIQPGVTITQQTWMLPKDIKSCALTLYRDVQQDCVLLAFVVPGLAARKHYYLQVITWLLARGRSSRLYKKLVEELRLVNELTAYYRDMFEHGLVCVLYYPKPGVDNEVIIRTIKNELNACIKEGISELELTRAMNQVAVEYCALAEKQQEFTDELGKWYLATEDIRALDNYLITDVAQCAQEVQELFKTYFLPCNMHQALLLPYMNEHDKKQAMYLQEQADEADECMLAQRVRGSELGSPDYSLKIKTTLPVPFKFPLHQVKKLKNDTKIIYCHRDNVPLITVVVDFLAKQDYDSPEHLGLNYMAMQTIIAAQTSKRSSSDLAQEFELYGMSIEAGVGCISLTMHTKDFERGLELLHEIITQSLLDDHTITTVRDQTASALQAYWDDPSQYIKQLAREDIYGRHPYAHNPLGTLDSIQNIQRNHIVDFYSKYITPYRTQICVIGDLAEHKVPVVVERYFDSWQGPVIPELQYPPLPFVRGERKIHAAQRDQVAIALVGLSVTRFDSNYNALALLDVIITGGMQNSMNSRLFALRERSGLFYGISGSLITGASKEKGMIYLQTLTSAENVDTVISSIKQVLHDATTITDDDVLQALIALYSSCIDMCESQKELAELFLFIERYNLSKDYLFEWQEQLMLVTKNQISNAAQKFLIDNKLDAIVVGQIKR